MNYTLVLYKSDGCNTCRGCVMEQWGSDFSLDTNVEEKDAIERIVEAFCRWSDGGSYQANLFSVKNNEQVIYEFDQYSSSYPYNQAGSYSVKSYHPEDWEDAIVKDATRINDLIRARVVEVQEKERLAAEKEKQRQKEEEAKQQELYERQQLAALQQKYAKE